MISSFLFLRFVRIKFWRIEDGTQVEYYDELALDLSFSSDGRWFCYGGAGTLSLAHNTTDDFETSLFYGGDALAGNTIEIRLFGPDGADPVGLWVGSGLLEQPLVSIWGNWYLQFPVIGPIVFPPIPSAGEHVFPVTIPATPPGPYDLLIQALIGSELTNACVLTVPE